MTRRGRRRWIARLLGALLPIPLAACSCGPEADPLAQQPHKPAPTPDKALPAAVSDAYQIWEAEGVHAPDVPIMLGEPPTLPASSGFRADGFCLCNPDDPARSLIVVRYAIPTLIAHELGHAMGLHHVPQSAQEIMSPIVQPWAAIGPDTLAELRRVRAERGGPPQ